VRNKTAPEQEFDQKAAAPGHRQQHLHQQQQQMTLPKRLSVINEGFDGPGNILFQLTLKPSPAAAVAVRRVWVGTLFVYINWGFQKATYTRRPLSHASFTCSSHVSISLMLALQQLVLSMSTMLKTALCWPLLLQAAATTVWCGSFMMHSTSKCRG
jgi:hypothetical protein